MFPLGGGFSAGPATRRCRVPSWGVGMAKALYANAIQAVGPDAIVIAQPMIPGTEQHRLRADRQRALHGPRQPRGARQHGGSPLVPTPQADHGATTIAAAATSPGATAFRPATNPATQPAAPSRVREPGEQREQLSPASTSIWRRSAGRTQRCSQRLIRSQVAQVAQNLWQNKTVRLAHAAARHLSATPSTPTPSELTTAATTARARSTQPCRASAAQARNGNIDLLKSEVQQSTLGWTAAGAYYLEIAKAQCHHAVAAERHARSRPRQPMTASAPHCPTIWRRWSSAASTS